jgi:hypothetical protein
MMPPTPATVSYGESGAMALSVLQAPTPMGWDLRNQLGTGCQLEAHDVAMAALPEDG